jgi:hypothetical protein
MGVFLIMDKKDLISEKDFLKLKKNINNFTKQQDEILKKFTDIEEFTKEQIDWNIQDVDFLQNVIVNTYDKLYMIDVNLVCIIVFSVFINLAGVLLMIWISKT